VTGQEQLRSIDGETADPESSRPLRGALAYTFDGVLTMNPAGVIKQANHSACGILGRPIDMLIGRRVACRRVKDPVRGIR
jgi:PAS domain-containing protein